MTWASGDDDDVWKARSPMLMAGDDDEAKKPMDKMKDG